MGKSNGKIWPYAIAISIFLVFIAAVATVIIANKLPVEDSDTISVDSTPFLPMRLGDAPLS